MMKMSVLPLVNRRDKTGATVGEDSIDQLDWEDIWKRGKWPLLWTYYDLFKAHPTKRCSVVTRYGELLQN